MLEAQYVNLARTYGHAAQSDSWNGDSGAGVALDGRTDGRWPVAVSKLVGPTFHKESHFMS